MLHNLKMVVDKATLVHLLQLHNKLSNAQFAFKEVNFFPLHHSMFFSNLHKKIKQNLMFISHDQQYYKR
jgi:hypothetical protein